MDVREEHVYAMLDTCSHLGCSLAEGRLEGDRIVCACHGSEFGLDGSLLRGPATSPQPALDVRRRKNGALEVRSATSTTPLTAGTWLAERGAGEARTG